MLVARRSSSGQEELSMNVMVSPRWLGAIALAAIALGSTAPAVAQDRDRDGRGDGRGPQSHERFEPRGDRRHGDGPGVERRPPERRDVERHDARPDAVWRFDRGHGWRVARAPGLWSPYYVWWRVNGRVVMLAAPTATVVQYPTGRYELRGDGITAPYYWLWIPAPVVVAAPGPVVAPPLPPAPPPPPAGYELPPPISG
jgi:hypothetical protein